MNATRTRNARRSTRRRNVALRDEFGSHRGRPFLATAPTVVGVVERDELGRRVSARARLAYEVA
jgi:hypothetical protein